MALSGTEVLQITGADNLGRPAGTTETITTLQLGIYANSGVTPNLLSWSTVIAAGTTQVTATPISSVLNLVVATPVGSGVILPVPFNAAGTAAQQLYIINTGTNNLLIYPPVGMSLNATGTNLPFVLEPNLASVIIGLTPTSWSVAVANIPPGFQYNTNTAIGSTTLAGSALTGNYGFQDVTLAMTGALTGAATATLPSVPSMFGSIANPFIGQSWRFRFINESSNNQVWTIGAPAGWSTGGTLTMAQNTWRDFYVSLTAAASVGLQSIGTGTYS